MTDRYFWKLSCFFTGESQYYSSRSKAIVAGLQIGSGWKRIKREYLVIIDTGEDGSNEEVAVISKEKIL